MITEKHPICNSANYKTVSLYDFVYVYKCFPDGWEDFLALKEVKQDITEISPLLTKEAKKRRIEPAMQNMFKAFEVARNAVKVVIIGQDPVPEAGKATGLAFSLQEGANPRDSVPTVFNMLVELKLEGMNVDLTNGDLTPWVDRGVLLLNAALTVRQGTSKGNAGSHQGLWEEFTDLLVEHINNYNPPTAWILWGDDAKDLAGLITQKKHFIKAGGHPSPQGKNAGSRFFGRNYFKCANDFLENKLPGKLVYPPRGGVDWGLPSQAVIGKKPEDCDENGL